MGLGILVYLNSLNGAFVIDDVTSIPKNPLVDQPLKNLIAGRLVHFTFSINYLLGGLHPFIYHLTNIFIHLGVVILVYFFLLEIVSQKISLLAAAIFAVHPIHTEPVSWISGRTYLLGTLFLLASLLLYIIAYKRKKYFHYYYISSLICFLMAQLLEIKSVAFLLIIGLYELIFGKIKKRWRWLIPYFALTLLFLASLVKPFLFRVSTQNPQYTGEISLFNPLRQIPAAIGSYIELFVWPMDLTFYHEDFTVHFFLRLGITIALLCSLIYFYIKKHKILFFGFSLFILSLVPTLMPIKIAFVVAERYVYFGSIGLCLVAAWALVEGLKKYPQVLFVVFGILILLLSARTITRNRDWRTFESLWFATAKTSPTSSMAWNNVGYVYTERGNLEMAIEAFQRAISLNPRHAGAHHNLGIAYFKLKNYDQAIFWFEKSIALNPVPQVYQDLGVVYVEKGEFGKAEEQFRKILKFDPNCVMAYNSLGVIFYKQGRIEEARLMWQKALELDPNSVGVKKNLILLEQNLQASPSASPQL